MNKKFIASVFASAFAGLGLAQAPATWTVTPNDYNYSMQVTCKLNRNCADLANTSNKVAAFVNGQCRGVVGSNIVVGPDHLAMLIVYSNVVSGENVKFEVYDAGANDVFNVIDSITYSNGSQVGGISSPYKMTNNHAPTNISISTIVFMETIGLGDAVAGFTAVDDDNPNVFTYSLPAGQYDNNKFGIAADSLITASLFDYETDSTDTIMVTVTDANACSYSEMFVMHVNDKNDTPAAVIFVPQLVYDHDAAGKRMGNFSTLDPDPYDTHTYSLVAGVGDNDNAAFYITGDSLRNVNQLDWATKKSYKFRIRSTDVGGLFVEDTFSLQVINVNDPPVAFNDSGAVALLEDGANGTVNIIANDTDLDGNPTAPTNAAGKFSVDADTSLAGTQVTYTGTKGVWTYDPATGNMVFDPALNYYGTAVLTYQLCDSSNACDLATVKFVVNPMNDPVVAVKDSVAAKLLEDGSNGTVNILTNDTDIDEPVIAPLNGPSQFRVDINQSLAGVQTVLTTTTGVWTLDTLTGVLTYNPANDFYGLDTLIYTICDDSLACSNAKVYFNVHPMNDAPSGITLSNDTISENLPALTFVARLTTTDIDTGGTHTYSLVAGAGDIHNSFFFISNDTLYTDTVLNFEYEDTLRIRIQTMDDSLAVFQSPFLIKVKDNNDTPENILLPADSVYEQSPIDTLVGRFSTTDQDPTNTHTYSLVAGAGSTDNALFNITGDSLRTSQVFLYMKQTYSIRVRTTDNAGAFFEKVFAIKVLDVNAVPTDITIDTLTLAEDNATDFYISKMKTVDIDLYDTYTYSLVAGAGDGDNDQFTIVGDNLYLNTKTNYDIKTEYNFRVRSTDNASTYIEKAFVLTVTDISGNNIPLPSANYVSPNGDGKNDYWWIENVVIYKDFSLQILDQFGHIVYSVPDGYNNEWDGKLNGDPLPTGNYYYVFKRDGKMFKGNITVVNQ